MKKLSIDRTVSELQVESDWRGKRERLYEEFGYALKELLESAEALRIREYRIYLEAISVE